MSALALFIVLAVAKVLVLLSYRPAISVWAPVAYFRDDIALAVLWMLLERLIRSRRIAWTMYVVAVVYIAINVPIAIVVGSPLTPALIRAAGGPMSDSIRQYVSPSAIAAIASIVVAGVGAAWGTRRLERIPVLIVTAGIVAVALSPAARARVHTGGFERNAFTALLPIRFPAMSMASITDPRASPFANDGEDGPTMPGSIDLSRYRGAAHSFNLLMIVLESTAAAYLRPYGAADDPMPVVTGLANRGLLFENAYATYPESIKELFAELCSRYPAFGASVSLHAAASCASLPSLLRATGYRTAMFHSGRFEYLGMADMLREKGFDRLDDAGTIGGNRHSSFGVDEAASVHRLLQWIDETPAQRPFFAAYLPAAGHHPYLSDGGPFDARSEFGRYENALHEGDAALGQLLDGLRARNLEDRTVVIIYGDHGEAFGQHPGNIGHTMFINEENVRVPLIISMPWLVSAQVRVRSTASIVDIAPTVLDLLLLPAHSDHQGESLLIDRPRVAFFLADYSLGWLGLRDGCWKYQLDLTGDRSTLFNVCRDPTETRDRSAEWPARIRAYRERVQSWSSVQRRLLGASHVSADGHADDRQDQ